MPKHIYDMISKKSNNKTVSPISTSVRGKQKIITPLWKTHVPPPPIPLTRIHTPEFQSKKKKK